MDVTTVMTPNPASCTPETPIRDVARLMLENDCGEIPVIDAARRPIGVVTDRDITVRIVAQARDVASARAVDCMSTPVTTVRADNNLADCCEVMETRQIRRVPVVDNDGALVGIVSLADIALAGRDRRTADVVKEVSEPASRH